MVRNTHSGKFLKQLLVCLDSISSNLIKFKRICQKVQRFNGYGEDFSAFSIFDCPQVTRTRLHSVRENFWFFIPKFKSYKISRFCIKWQISMIVGKLFQRTLNFQEISGKAENEIAIRILLLDFWTKRSKNSISYHSEKFTSPKTGRDKILINK